MKSIGIAVKEWDDSKKDGRGEQTSNYELPPIDLNINLWMLRYGKFQLPVRYYIDFGIKAKFSQNDLMIYLPFELEKSNKWEDLGETICKNPELLSSLFNEELSAIPSSPTDCFYEVKPVNSSNTDFPGFMFYTLNSDNVEAIKEKADADEDKYTGSILRIKIPKCDNPGKLKDYYVRFRIPIPDITKFAYQSHISNDLIQAAFTKVDMYDLRINDKRNLDKKVKERLLKDDHKFVSFEKVHIFYIASPKTSIGNMSTQQIGTRIIDPDIWNSYIPRKTYHKCTLANHWKFTGAKVESPTLIPTMNLVMNSGGNSKVDMGIAPTEDCKPKNINEDEVKNNKPLDKVTLFFTATYPKIRIATLITYFAIIVLLGSLASWLASSPSDDSQLLGNGVKIYILLFMAGWVILYWIFKHIRLRNPFYLEFD